MEVDNQTDESLVLFAWRKLREIAELLQTLMEKHPTQTVYATWDNCNAHKDNEVEVVARATAGRLVLLYLPTYNP